LVPSNSETSDGTAASGAATSGAVTQRLSSVRLLDRIAVGGMLLGLALYVVPLFGAESLRCGFGLTLAFTLFHIYASALASRSSR
jgi:hypothetical protein